MRLITDLLDFFAFMVLLLVILYALGIPIKPW